jgi:hypothetical protein
MKLCGLSISELNGHGLSVSCLGSLCPGEGSVGTYYLGGVQSRVECLSLFFTDPENALCVGLIS